MDKQEVATEIRGRWKDMPEADVIRVIDAIWQHANHHQIELTRCYTRDVGERDWQEHDEPAVAD